MDLREYFLRRLGLMLVVIFGVTLIAFIVSHLVPINPIVAMAGSQATMEQIEAASIKWGMDQPLHIQYGRYMWNLLHGDFGISLWSGRHVTTDVAEFFPATFELATTAIIIAIVMGIPLGVISATRRNKPIDHVTRVFSLIGVSTPNFWLGLVLLYLFYFKLGWAGPGRLSPIFEPPPSVTNLYVIDSILAGQWDVLADSIKHLILPAFALGYFVVGIVTRLTRSTLLDVLSRDYIRAARARGLSERVVKYRHALKNALIPTATVIGIMYGVLLGGAIIIEAIYTWPGLGLYAYQAIFKIDVTAIIGIAIFMALFYSIINLVVDIMYAYLDPRIRYD